MKLTTATIPIVLAGVSAAAVLPSPPEAETIVGTTGRRIPTSYESAVMGRRILALTPLGTLATVFPADRHHGHLEADDSSSGMAPLSLVDYVADCESAGNPTLLAVDIAAHFRNVRAGSNISLALRWAPPHPPSKRISSTSSSSSSAPSLVDRLLDYLGRRRHDDDNDDGDDSDKYEPIPYSAANLPRFSLMGYLESMKDDSSSEVSDADLRKCFVDAHPDARYWLPGNRIHRSHFARLVVTQIYWVGGFGDRAYIGWIPAEQWHSVTRSEWEAIRLPGEKEGWEEWSVYDGDQEDGDL